MSGQEIKVLLIASCDRSGSTVVGNILGSGANFFHGGEIHHVWGRGLIGNWLCGCGQPFRECDLWTGVLEDAFGGADRVDAHSMANLRMIAYSKQNRLLAFSAEGRRHLQATLSGYLENLSKLYRAIQTRAGAKVIVDSSKTAVHGWLLTMLPAIDLCLLHLVRDARGVAYSLGKKKLYLGAPEQRHMARHGPGKSSRMWLRDNLGIESLSSSLPGRSLKVRYEDFVAGPRDVLRSVCELVGEDASKLPPVVASRVEIQASHTVSGNPMRLATGALEIRPDEEWRAKMRFSSTRAGDRSDMARIEAVWVFGQAAALAIRLPAPSPNTTSYAGTRTRNWLTVPSHRPAFPFCDGKQLGRYNGSAMGEPTNNRRRLIEFVLGALALSVSCSFPESKEDQAGRPAPPPPALTQAQRAAIDEVTGVRGTFFAEEGVYKVTFPRTDVEVRIDGRAFDPFLGLTSWASFTPMGTGGLMVMGDLTLFEDEVNPVMSVALDQGLEVTALHNHFFYDRPKVMFMHIGGRGSAEALATAVARAIAKVAEIRRISTQPAAGFLGMAIPEEDWITPENIDNILGLKGAMKGGMYKAVIGRRATMHGREVGKQMGVNTWAAFAGSDENASVDGDFAVLESELQGVLKTLRRSDINIVAIHNHMVYDQPRYIFLHYWGRGSTVELARGIRTALDGLGSG